MFNLSHTAASIQSRKQLISIVRFLWLPVLLVSGPAQSSPDVILPSLSNDLISYYDFDHPAADDAGQESDLGLSGTALYLVNGGASMRIEDAAYPTAGRALQTKQVNPTVNGNDDWKAGLYDADGVTTLGAFNAVGGISLMGWVKPTGTNPNLNSTTEDASDLYNAVGLFGLLSGNSDGHAVRALLEIIRVADTLRLVALGRRDDAGNSLILAANDDWEALLPGNTWTHLAATYNFDDGTMTLYRNGELLPASYTSVEDNWLVVGDPEPDVVTASDPAGIKIGGSFPQNTAEKNAFNGRFDDLMFFKRTLTAAEVQAQFAQFIKVQKAPPAK
jgi:Concanavalin A-like lectin/glucanases superfamily